MTSPLLRLLRDHVSYVIFLLVTVFFALVAPNFASLSTVSAILRITAIVSVIATGMTFVIIAAEIDLSVGSVASFSGMVLALLLEAGVPGPISAALTLLMGAAIGVVNGLLVTLVRIPSFLVTLGMLSVFSGAALTVTNTMPVPIIQTGINNVFWNGTFLTIAAPLWWTGLTVVAGFYLLHVSLFGRRVLAVGGNAVAANFSGIRVGRTKIWAFVMSGTTAALAGMMLAARSTAGNPSLGEGLELDVIAAVIIGGTSLFGGYGSILGSVIGAIFIGIIGFGLLVMGFSTSVQEIIKGAIIILAVSVNRR